MVSRDYFPLGKAYGEAFCNRVDETEWLVGNINSVKHSLLIAPRRYGKSSLAEKAITASGAPFVRINLHLCTTEQEISEEIIGQVSKLIGKSVGKLENLMTKIKSYVTNLTPKLSFGGELVSLELEQKHDNNYAVSIVEALLLLERLLADKKIKAVIFFDEFQELVKISKTSKIEGAIRTAAQEMKHLSLIFSGSIRSLLLSMFEDEKKPLYKLCRKLKLERISPEHYLSHLNKVSIETWGKELTDEVFESIMQLTHHHPYYVNYLCDIVWSNAEYPTIDRIYKSWKQVIHEEWRDVLKELSVLTIPQRKVLKYISVNQTTSLTNQKVSQLLSLPVSTIGTAVNALLEKDYIEISDTNIYQIIDPLIYKLLADAQKNEAIV